jgi:hypothetical protein
MEGIFLFLFSFPLELRESNSVSLLGKELSRASFSAAKKGILAALLPVSPSENCKPFPDFLFHCQKTELLPVPEQIIGLCSCFCV